MAYLGVLRLVNATGAGAAGAADEVRVAGSPAAGPRRALGGSLEDLGMATHAVFHGSEIEIALVSL